MTSTSIERRIANDDRTPSLVRTLLGRAVCELLVEPDVMDFLVRPNWKSGRV